MKGREVERLLSMHGDKAIRSILPALGDELTQVQHDVREVITLVNGMRDAVNLLTEAMMIHDRQLDKVVQRSDTDE